MNLAPCPFCGSAAEFDRLGTHSRSCQVSCTSCGAHHESGDEGERSGASWNRRVAGFAGLREGNADRHTEWWTRDGVKDVTLEFRGNELAGEVGEACNVIKKLARERLGIMGSRDTVDHFAEELADVIICVDLIAMDLGLDLGAAVARKFNATSEKLGLKTKLRGFADTYALMALIVVLWLVAVAACSLAGHILVERDRAVAERAASDHATNVCLVELRSTVERVHALRARIDLHNAIAEDACIEVSR